ncbi:MAG TPA: Zn-dependent hydrolase [Synergistales bacterium]|nr:Zn-dependent hydrolase [Synergistales bacterium]
MKADLDRIRKDLENLALFNATPGKGLTRFSLTPEDRGARDYLSGRLRELGVHVYEDAAASLFGRREGGDPSLPPIMIGSHFDSVRHGGNFDGQAGVVAALEVLRCLEERGVRTAHPVEMIAMIEEEGGRFGAGFLSSRAMTRGVTREELEQRKDEDGVTLAEALTRFGFDPARIAEARRKPGEVRAFLEMHIEQGPVLEREGFELGIVTSIVGTDLTRVTVEGRPDHAGTTPMDMRRDALRTAAAVIGRVPSFAAEQGGDTVATVGSLVVRPGAANVVPGEVEFTLDIRSLDALSIKTVKDRVRRELDERSAADGTAYRAEQLLEVGPVELDEGIRRVLQDQADGLGFSWRAMSSGAGHDAMIMAPFFPTGMIFVPSRGGRSHCPEEWTDFEDLQKGVELLYHAVTAIDSRGAKG